MYNCNKKNLGVESGNETMRQPHTQAMRLFYRSVSRPPQLNEDYRDSRCPRSHCWHRPPLPAGTRKHPRGRACQTKGRRYSCSGCHTRTRPSLRGESTWDINTGQKEKLLLTYEHLPTFNASILHMRWFTNGLETVQWYNWLTISMINWIKHSLAVVWQYTRCGGSVYMRLSIGELYVQPIVSIFGKLNWPFSGKYMPI